MTKARHRVLRQNNLRHAIAFTRLRGPIKGRDPSCMHGRESSGRRNLTAGINGQIKVCPGVWCPQREKGGRSSYGRTEAPPVAEQEKEALSWLWPGLGLLAFLFLVLKSSSCRAMGYLSCRTEGAVVTCQASGKESAIQPPKIKNFRFKELEHATGGFTQATLLGKGSYGWVYKGTLLDGMKVAVKRASLGRRNLPDENPLENELQILSKIRSSRLVNLIGFSRDCKEMLLVVEFMANGNLYDILHCRPESLSWNLRVQLALQVAKAIRALHCATPPVIHRDIKSSNVLLDSDWNAKVGDFGLALRGPIEDVIRLATPPAGTMGYLDPGYVTPSHLSTKTDVFSFGILLLEIMSGRNAIDVQYHPPNIVDWAIPLVKQGKAMAVCDPKVKKPANMDALNDMAVIAARCVRLSSSRRPTMAEVVKGLREIRKRIQQPIWNSLGRSLRPIGIEDLRRKERVCDEETAVMRSRSVALEKCRARAKSPVLWSNRVSKSPLELQHRDYKDRSNKNSDQSPFKRRGYRDQTNKNSEESPLPLQLDPPIRIQYIDRGKESVQSPSRLQLGAPIQIEYKPPTTESPSRLQITGNEDVQFSSIQLTRRASNRIRSAQQEEIHAVAVRQIRISSKIRAPIESSPRRTAGSPRKNCDSPIRYVASSSTRRVARSPVKLVQGPRRSIKLAEILQLKQDSCLPRRYIA